MVSTLFCYLQPNFRNKIEILSKKLSHVKGREGKESLACTRIKCGNFKKASLSSTAIFPKEASRCFVIKTDFK